MRLIPRGRIGRILILACVLVGARFVSVALSQTTNSTAIDYVTIKLKDGRMLEGQVLLEDNQQITIEAQYANGTITHRVQIDKSDIAALSHLGAAERDQRLATVAYHDLGKYQLDPQKSFSLSYYDTAINQGFLPFLRQYPQVMETATVSNRLADWQAERSLVASGQVKYHGRWMTAAEANKLEQTELARQVIQDARALMAQRQFEAATERLAPYYSATEPPQLAAESRRLQTDVYRMWVSGLEATQEHLTKDLEASKERVTRLSEVRSKAQANYDQARSKSLSSGPNASPRMLGDSAITAQASADYLRAENQFNQEQNRQFALQEQLDNTAQELREVHQARDLFAAAYPSIELVKETPAPKTNAPAPPPPPPPPPPPSVVDEMAAWFSRNWIAVAAVALLGLWGVSRLFTRS